MRVRVLLTAAILVGSVPSCTETARITDVYSSLDGQGSRKRNIFFTDSKEVHCVVEMGIGRDGATVEVLFRQQLAYDFEGDRFFDTDRVAASAENSPAPGGGIQKFDVRLTPVAAGAILNSAPFPPGRYQCEAYLDGKLEQTSIFNIEFPACPISAIEPASFCYGYYRKQTECLRYGLTSKDPAKCRCTVEDGWTCEP